HDVSALLDLFTDEDAGPTVTADQYAWLKFEIGVWAQHQADMDVHVDAHDYRLTEHGAAWDADVYRSDWAAAGVRAMGVANSIWVHSGKVARFSSRARSAVDAAQLGSLWRPGATSDP